MPDFARLSRRVGKRVRALRKERGWSVDEAAARFRIAQAALRRLEKGAANPSLAMLVSIARALGSTVEDLLRGRNRSPAHDHL